jgi:hypothetical protein
MTDNGNDGGAGDVDDDDKYYVYRKFNSMKSSS